MQTAFQCSFTSFVLIKEITRKLLDRNVHSILQRQFAIRNLSCFVHLLCHISSFIYINVQYILCKHVITFTILSRFQRQYVQLSLSCYTTHWVLHVISNRKLCINISLPIKILDGAFTFASLFNAKLCCLKQLSPTLSLSLSRILQLFRNLLSLRLLFDSPIFFCII